MDDDCQVAAKEGPREIPAVTAEVQRVCMTLHEALDELTRRLDGVLGPEADGPSEGVDTMPAYSSIGAQIEGIRCDAVRAVDRVRALARRVQV